MTKMKTRVKSVLISGALMASCIGGARAQTPPNEPLKPTIDTTSTFATDGVRLTGTEAVKGTANINIGTFNIGELFSETVKNWGQLNGTTPERDYMSVLHLDRALHTIGLPELSLNNGPINGNFFVDTGFTVFSYPDITANNLQLSTAKIGFKGKPIDITFVIWHLFDRGNGNFMAVILDKQFKIPLNKKANLTITPSCRFADFDGWLGGNGPAYIAFKWEVAFTPIDKSLPVLSIYLDRQCALPEGRLKDITSGGVALTFRDLGGTASSLFRLLRPGD